MILEAVFGSHERRLHKGERGVVALVAPNQSMTDVALGYIRGYLEASPLLAPMIDNATAGKVHLSNRLDIVGFPCTKAALRSWSIPVGVLDELGFYRLEGSVESDAEIQASIRRGMVGFDVGSKLVKISTPYIKGGVLYEDVKRAFGRNDPDLLVWRAPSRLMNPMLATERLDRERRLDPLRFAREYEAEFAEDVAAFLPSAWVDAAVVAGRYELPPPAVAVFFAVDSSGGGSAVFTLAGLHCEDRAGRVYYVHDVLKGWTRTRSGRSIWRRRSTRPPRSSDATVPTPSSATNTAPAGCGRPSSAAEFSTSSPRRRASPTQAWNRSWRRARSTSWTTRR